jgi:hypothetical protein
MMPISINSKNNRKRPRPHAEEEEELQPPDNCSFCGQVPAALTVQVPVLLRKKRAAAPYCLVCYYTTAAVRQDAKYVSVMDQAQLDEQLPPLQQLFSEAFVDLQKELSDESTRSFAKQKSDPLALLHRPAPKRVISNRSSKPPPQKKKAGDAADGGFLRNTPLPERLLRTQQQQAQLQQAQTARMTQAAATSSFFQRRKASRQSIWNLAMDPNTKTTSEETAPSLEHISVCSCGSKDVQSFGNITSRNKDSKKGETWGMKDRGDDVVSRYQCNQCGKMWNEEE